MIALALMLLTACPEPTAPLTASALGGVVAECEQDADRWTMVVGYSLDPSDALDVYVETGADSQLLTPDAGVLVFDAPCSAEVTVRLWDGQDTGAAVVECAGSVAGLGPDSWPDCSPFWVRHCDSVTEGEGADDYPGCELLLP